MAYRNCANCRVPAKGILCVDCVRMIVATVAGELIVVVIVALARALGVL
jgi:hypothetical protein